MKRSYSTVWRSSTIATIIGKNRAGKYRIASRLIDLCVSLNSRLDSNKEEEEHHVLGEGLAPRCSGAGHC